MKLWFALIVIAASFSMLHFIIAPALEKSWKTSGNIGKFAKLGTIAATKTLADFLKIALIVFGIAFLILTILSVIAPVFGAGLLDASYGFVAWLHALTEPVRSFLGGAIFWIALLGLFWWAWRMKKGDLTKTLETERRRQIDVLLAENATLADLPPTADMDKLAQNIATCDMLAADLAGTPDAGAQSKLKQLLELRDALVSQYAFLDVDRRIDLSDVSIADPAPAKEGFWSRLRLGLFSKGMQKSLSASDKLLRRGGIVAACLLVIGVGSPVLANAGLVPTLGSINDIQVYRSQQAAQDSLKKIARAAVQEPADALPAASSPVPNYRLAAEQFARALIASSDWRSSVARAQPDLAATTARRVDLLVEEVAIRDNILRQFSSNAAERAIPIRGVGFAEADAMPESARRQYGEFRDFIARNAVAPQGSPLVDRIEQWMRAKAGTSSAFRERLATGMASFRQPATLGDMFGTVLEETLSSSLDAALPDPADRALFAGQADDAARKGLQDPASRMVQVKLTEFLADIESGRGYADAMARVQARGNVPALFTQADAVRARAAVVDGDLNMARVAATADDLHPSLEKRNSPKATTRVERAVSQLRPVVSGGDDLRRAIEGSAGSYEDLFPGRAQAHAESPLGRALARIYGSTTELPAAVAEAASGGFGGGGGGGGSAASGDRPGNTRMASRSFTRLRGSVRVGGVLIGADPTAGAPLDVRDIGWRVDGATLALTLKLADRTIDVGRFDGETVQQALAYAADERPTTVTMTSGPLMPKILRVHLHPSLVDTELGCHMIELDRFVDTATGDWSDRSLWSNMVNTQLAVYNAAAGDRGALGMFDGAEAQLFAAAINDAFPDSWRQSDAAQSVFAHAPQRFDMDLVGQMKQCRPKAADGRDAYMRCVAESFTTKPPQPFAIWSGVREASYPLTVAGLTPTQASADGDPVLRFMLQVAFENEVECEDGDCPETGGVPWEFPVIAKGVGDRTMAFAQGNPAAARILGKAEQFTALQRLFRAALSGALGPNFPRHKLIALMRDAAKADPIDRVPTPDWNQSRESATTLLALLKAEPRRTPDESALADTQIDFVGSVLEPASGERFSGTETCRGGALALR